MTRRLVIKATWMIYPHHARVVYPLLRVPRSQRSGEIIEPMVSEQWFVRMEPLARPALAAVASHEITILPERFEKIYNNWLENIKVGMD